MAFRKLPVRAKTRDMVDTFLGYDHNLRIPEGAFYEMKNLSSDKYPVLSPRPGRATALNIMGDTTGIIMKDKLCFTCGTAFYHGDTRIEMELSGERKQLVSMGAYVLIFPDRKYINTADHSDRGDIDASYSTNGEVTIHICRPNGESYAAEYISDTEPESPVDKGVWVNTSEYPNTLHQWNEAAKCWTAVTSSCIKLYTDSVGDVHLGDLFEVGDGITISGIKGSSDVVDFQTGEPLTEKQREQLNALDGSAVILDKGDNWIVINGIMDAKVTIATVVTIKREMPVMDFIVEHGNQAISLLQKYGGKDADGALTTVRYWEFRRDNPGVNVDDSWIDKYYSEIQDSGMSIETYVSYRDQVKGITGTGKKEGRMAVIGSLPISDAQKDALYYSEGWAKSRIYEAPWH